MSGVFMARQLPPWFENLSKRQVKAPKVYVRDSGILHALLFVKGKRIGVECKRTDAPGMTASMRVAMESLRLDRLIVAYPGELRYPLGKKVEVVPLPQSVEAR